MNRSRLTSLLSISIGAILVIGAIAPALTQQAYGQLVTIGSVSTMEDLNAPTYRGNPGWFVFAWEDLAIFGDPGTRDCINQSGLLDLNTFDGLEPFPGAVMGGPVPPIVLVLNDGSDPYNLPNWIDQFPLKTMRIQVSWCDSIGLPPPVITGITAPGASCTSTSPPTVGTNPVTVTGALYFFQDFECIPNPDEETFELTYVFPIQNIIEVVVDTISEPPPRIGGTFEGVNTASLLVGSAQTNAFWLIPLITAIGIGIVLARRQFF